MTSSSTSAIRADTAINNGTRQTIKPKQSLGSRIFFSSMFLITVYGWLMHERFFLSAETGTGYYLGIIGGVMMLLLLLYPLRKKFRFMFIFGTVNGWFRLHMVLGIMGPIVVLYHANFSLGSVNSNVALFSMITVAFSGIIGRFFYTHIHFGLYGNAMTLDELRQNLKQNNELINKRFASLPYIEQQLKELATLANRKRNFLLQILWIPLMAIIISVKRNKIKQILKKEIKSICAKTGKDEVIALKNSLRIIYQTIDTTRTLAQLRTYERLFSLWHILHMPLFIMLLITGIVHVVAVHMY